MANSAKGHVVWRAEGRARGDQAHHCGGCDFELQGKRERADIWSVAGIQVAELIEEGAQSQLRVEAVEPPQAAEHVSCVLIEVEDPRSEAPLVEAQADDVDRWCE